MATREHDADGLPSLIREQWRRALALDFAEPLSATVIEAGRQQTGHALDDRERTGGRGCNLVDFESTAADRAMCA